MGIYSGWIDGLSKERGISGFFRGLIVSAGGSILAIFAVTFATLPFEQQLTSVTSEMIIITRGLVRLAFLFYPAYEVARRKALPVAWLWGLAAFGLGFPSNFTSSLIVGIAGAMAPSETPPEESEETEE